MSFNHLLKFGFIAAAASLLVRCANIVAPTGGAKDTTPPRLLAAKSTPNFQTNFKKQRLELTFDEWLKLDDAFNQIVVSPPLNERPEVTLNGKKIEITFGKDEILRENATYTVNFGTSVKDLNESNVVPNLRFVFSTGATIDSLTVRGQVVDAVTNQPVEGALLMLYDNFADSVVRKTKPFYFGKTDKNGAATIENVRAGEFKVFALADKDQNYLFNQDIEKIGFPDKNLIVNGDFAPSRIDTFKAAPRDTSKLKSEKLQGEKPKIGSNSPNRPLSIRLFEPSKKLILATKETDKYGVVKLIFNQEPTTARVRFDSIGQKTAVEISKDSLLIWYDLPTGDGAWNVYSRAADTSRTADTVRVRTRGRADFFRKAKLQCTAPQLNVAKHPTKSVVLPFNFPIDKIDTTKIRLLDTSDIKQSSTVSSLFFKKRPLSILRDSTSPRKLRFDADWQSGMKYELQILPTALTDIYGLTNDTVLLKIFVQPKIEFGDILLKINNLDSTKSYVAQIVNGAGFVERAFFIDNKKMFDAKIETVQPDEYVVKVIEDLNRNRRWDTGDYDAKRQPERIFLKTVEGLRADWEVEVVVTIEN